MDSILRSVRPRWLVCVLVVCLTAPALTQDPPQDATGDRIPPPRDTYMGRQIARTMHYTGAEWLIRDEREREERATLMLTNLGVEPGTIVCDMGCGNGFHAIPLARAVGDGGSVLAVDIQPEMLALLRDRAEEAGADNIIPILGSVHTPRLPAGEVDLVLMVDVYHEFSYPERMLAGIRDALAPGGRVVLVEFRAEDPNVPIRPLHKMTREQVLRELNANGFELVDEFDRLPWQHMMFFGRDDE